MRKVLPFHLLIAVLAIGLSAQASLPELTGPGLPSVLPVTVSGSNSNGYIDVDQNGSIDFIISYTSYSSYINCSIEGYSSGQILTVNPVPDAPQSTPLLSNPPLTIRRNELCTSLVRGANISGVAPLGSQWNWEGTLIADLSPTSVLNIPNSQQIAPDGYIGVQFNGTSGLYYGWLHYHINGGGSSVTIMSVGAAASAGAAAVAGLGDPYAVPVPLIASLLGFGLVGAGAWFKKKRKK